MERFCVDLKSGAKHAARPMSGRARIDAIDFWRGFALLTIFADHMPYSALAHVTHRNFGLSDAAEAFVFLSGMSAALAYGPRFHDGRIVAGLRAVGRRLLTLYGVHILLTPAVVIPVLTQHYAMLQRNLLYTGITRGKRLVVLVGQKKAVAIAVRNISGRRRWSKLNEWLAATAMRNRRKSGTA